MSAPLSVKGGQSATYILKVLCCLKPCANVSFADSSSTNSTPIFTLLNGTNTTQPYRKQSIGSPTYNSSAPICPYGSYSTSNPGSISDDNPEDVSPEDTPGQYASVGGYERWLPQGCKAYNYTTNITISGHNYVFKNWEFTYQRDYELERYCYVNGNNTNSTLLPMDIEDVAQCMPVNYFVWGFSSLLLYIIFAIQLAWTVGMFLVWLHANLRSQLIRHGRRVRGNYRAAVDFAEAVNKALGNEFCTYSDSEIARELEREGLALKYRTTELRDTGLSHLGLASSGFFILDRSRLYGAQQRRKKDQASQ